MWKNLVTVLLKILQWLSVTVKIKYKLLSVTFKVLHAFLDTVFLGNLCSSHTSKCAMTLWPSVVIHVTVLFQSSLSTLLPHHPFACKITGISILQTQFRCRLLQKFSPDCPKVYALCSSKANFLYCPMPVYSFLSTLEDFYVLGVRTMS